MERIDLEKIWGDRFHILTLSRRINSLMDKIEEVETIIEELKLKIDENKVEKQENTVLIDNKNEISDVDNTELNNKSLDIQNESEIFDTTKQNDNSVNTNTQTDEEIKNIVQNKIKESVNWWEKKRGKIARKNKNGNTIIRKSWGSVDKHLLD